MPSKPAKRLSAKDRIQPILKLLAQLYPDAVCALYFTNPLELLVATILSAQCTDKRVNIVTPALFKRYRTANDYAIADVQELEGLIKTTGFFRNKAKNIQACCKAIVELHGGDVPDTLEALVALSGIGRKTANVVLGNAFNTPGITVDTHVGRLSRRLGLTRHEDPVKVEFDLMKLVPQAEWTNFSHRLILHGRSVCSSLKPDCANCAFSDRCPKVGVKTKVLLKRKKKA